MRTVSVAALLLLLAGCAPTNVARSSCESHPFTIGDAWTCTVTGDIVAQASRIEFDTESRNRVAKVNIALQVKRGSLGFRYHDLTGEQRLVVTPSQPASVDMQTQMNPDRRSFTLFFEPVDGVVEGLTGTVKYSTP